MSNQGVSLHRSKVIRGAIVLFAVRILPRVVSPLITFAVMRLLGAEVFGAYSSVAALVGIVGTIAEFGLGPTVLKFLSNSREKIGTVLRNSLVLVSWSSALAFSITGLLMWLLEYDSIRFQLGLLLSVTYLVNGFCIVCMAYHQHLGEYRRIARVELINTVLHWVLTLPLALVGFDVRVIFALPVLAVGLNSLLQYGPTIWRIVGSGPNLSIQRVLLRDASLFASGNLLYQVYYQSDVVLLSLFVMSSAVGHYSGAYKFISMAYLVASTLFNDILYARYFEWRQSNPQVYGKVYVLVSKCCLAAGTAIGIGLFFVSPILVPILLGRDYAPSSLYLQILALTIPIRYLGASFGAVLVTHDMIPQRLITQLLAAVANVGINLLLVPQWGALGSAWTTVISESVICLGYGLLVHRLVFPMERLRELKVPLFLFVSFLPIVGQSIEAPFLVLVAFTSVAGLGLAMYLYKVGYFSLGQLKALWGGRYEKDTA